MAEIFLTLAGPALEASLKLTLAVHPVHSLSFGPATGLEDTALTVDRDELARHLLEDPRTARVCEAIAYPLVRHSGATQP